MANRLDLTNQAPAPRSLCVYATWDCEAFQIARSKTQEGLFDGRIRQTRQHNRNRKDRKSPAMKQRSFASMNFESKKKPTRREKFLGEMDTVVPWEALIQVSYPTAGRRGQLPMPAAAMLRIHFMQQWYALSDPALEDALYEIESMRHFAGLELNDDAIPDDTTILKSAAF